MGLGLLASAALAFSPPVAPRGSPWTPRRASAAITAALDPAAAASLQENLPALLGAVGLGGGAIFAYRQNEAKEAPATAAAPPAATPTPPAPLPPKASSWGLTGLRGVSPHRMTGTLPKPPPRELWVPPPGWTPPKKPPTATTGASWGLMGARAISPHRMTGTMPKPPPREIWLAPPGWTPPKKPESVFSWYDQGQRLVA